MSTDKEHVLTIGTKPNGEPYQCMIVDDSDFMVKNLRRIIESFDAEVLTTASNGQEAVQFVDEQGDELDFVTLDITMPEMDGLKALDKIKDIQPELKVIMVSAMGQEETVKKSVMKGAEHFIVKPFERDDVYERLDSVLQD